jgi:AcrR family transcriptional regulator
MQVSKKSRGPAKRRSREEQKTERGQELMKAAWDLFQENGYESVTVDHVAERAGYSRMPIYTLFGDKQGLFFELWRNMVGELESVLTGSMQPGAPLRDNLKALAERVASNPKTSANNSAEQLFFVVQTIALSRPDLAQKLQVLARGVVAHMAKAVETSTLAPGEALRGTAEAVAAHIVAQINGLATVEFQTHSRYIEPRELAGVFQAIALK